MTRSNRSRAVQIVVAVVLCAAVLVGGVWAAVAVLSDDVPSHSTVETTLGIALPESAVVLSADIAELSPRDSGDRGEVDFEMPASELEGFLGANGLETPTPVGDVPSGHSQASIPRSCGEIACYSGDILIKDGTARVVVRGVVR
ncbi:hypothetical protein [Salininema proteolyticum]|uniref:Uncharacterized protein n=1 Tax=Salininema proteolyticum TaxID=1607685 RepID=A0ABV8U323_9ACTN